MGTIWGTAKSLFQCITHSPPKNVPSIIREVGINPDEYTEKQLQDIAIRLLPLEEENDAIVQDLKKTKWFNKEMTEALQYQIEERLKAYAAHKLQKKRMAKRSAEYCRKSAALAKELEVVQTTAEDWKDLAMTMAVCIRQNASLLTGAIVICHKDDVPAIVEIYCPYCKGVLKTSQGMDLKYVLKKHGSAWHERECPIGIAFDIAEQNCAL